MAIVWKIWLSLPKGKVAVDYSLQASLTFGNRRWHIWSSPICCRCIRHRNYAFVAAFTKSRRGNSKTFSQAVPKRCQWKIDVWIRESFRRQNGYKIAVMLGRNPVEYFELDVFLRGLRKKQHRLGAAWGIQKGFNQRLCIETALTQKSSHGHCLEDLAVLTQGKSSGRLQPSSQLDFQQSEMAYLVVSHMLQMHSPWKLRVCCSFHQV